MKTTRWMVSLGLVCASAYADTVVTRGPWDLFADNTLLQAGFSSEAACINDATVRNVTRTYNCRTRTTVAVTQVSSPPPAGGGGSGNYSTTFGATEFPISEGGRWRKANNPWTPVRTANGTAFGSNGVTNSYDDSYALLTGFGPDQTVEATVQVNSGSEGATHEVELLLRASDDNNNARGYEVLFNKAGGNQIVRWNGAFGSFTPLSNNCSVQWTPNSALRTGDVIKAEMIGNTLKAWQNGVLKACVQDSTFTSGNPGISFFIRPGGANNLLTFTSFTATSR